MWSKKFSYCQECGTVDKPHEGKGLCGTCYRRHYKRQNADKNREEAKAYYYRNQEVAKAKALQRHYLYRNERLLYMQLYREEAHFDGVRNVILERDNHKCQICPADAVVVHHKDGNGRGSDDPNNDLDNLISLCRSCHCIIHKPRLGTGKDEDIV